MTDLDYLHAACVAYDEACRAAGWPVVDRAQGVRQRRPRGVRPGRHAARNAEIAAAFATGETATEIGERMGLTPTTVRNVIRDLRGAGQDVPRRRQKSVKWAGNGNQRTSVTERSSMVRQSA